MNDRLDQIKEYWDAAAQDKDVDVKYISDISTEKCLKEIGKLKHYVLEIGCGVGRLMQPGYHGIDISPNMLEIAKERKPDCYFRLTKDGDIPYKDKRFNSVYCMLVFQHLKPDEVFNYIKEAYRVLKHGGVFKFQFIEGDEREPFSNHYTRDEMTNWCLSAGFKAIEYSQSEAHELWTWAEVIK